MSVELGRELCGDLQTASAREWLVVNGIGGFACGTVSGVLGRRYHGLLFAALQPPLGRTLLVSHIDETAELAGRSYPLFTSRWQNGAVSGHGYRHIERFVLDGRIPTWTYALGDALLEKRIVMARERNTTYVEYTLLRGSITGTPLQLRCKPLVNYRDYHGETHAHDWTLRVRHQPGSDCVRVCAYNGATPFVLRAPHAHVDPEHCWYRDYALLQEQERGFPGHEDHLCIGELRLTLHEGQTRCLILSCEADAHIDPDSRRVFAELRAADAALLAQASLPDDPPDVAQLILASDAFVVRRAVPSAVDSAAAAAAPATPETDQTLLLTNAPANPSQSPPQSPPQNPFMQAVTAAADPPSGTEPGVSIIAGYPWFSDWGRDSMISLPGLLLCTGRSRQARLLLRTYAHFLDQGLIPNRFPDAKTEPEYNTADATLWLVEALRAYVDHTDDLSLVHELWPALHDIVAWHDRGTRHGIACDPADGLLRAGEPGVQLTWMDAKVGDWVVTPRIGKPVEINALWYNALCVLGGLARRLGRSQQAAWYEARAARTQAGFARFFRPDLGRCCDVLDGPQGDDPSLRPNQIFAVSLPHSPLPAAQQRAVVDGCLRDLYTSRGLRSLSPSDPAYVGHYSGDVRSRDGAYHQGTVWAFLLGPFALAHHRVYGDAHKARAFLLPMLDHLDDAGLGQISEIFDGDPPFLPRGCIAQAWSVAEWLRAFRQLSSADRTTQQPRQAQPNQA